MKTLIGLILGLAMLAAACGGDSSDDTAGLATEQNPEEPAEPAGEAGDQTGNLGDAPEASGDSGDEDQGESGDPGQAPSGGDGGDLCAVGAQIQEDATFDNVTIFDGEEFFDVMDQTWARVAAAAPADLQDEVSTISGALGDMQVVLAEFDYDLFDPELQAALEGFDTAEMDKAGEAFTTYLEDLCGIDLDAAPGPADPGGAPALDPGDLDELQENLQNIDPNDTIAILAQVFGIDEELASCLDEELGGLDPDDIDPAVLTRQVCGTTLLEVMTGAG